MDALAFHHTLVLNALIRGAETLDQLVGECEGLYPLELLAILDELVERDYVIRTPAGYSSVPTALTVERPHSRSPAKIEAPSIILPEPHPHDFDWRFDASTTSKLVDLMCQNLPPYGRILLIGAPSLFAAMVQLGDDAPPTTLVDWNQSLNLVFDNASLPSHLRFICVDLLHQALPSDMEPVDIVVCDPPWYPEYYRIFLGQGASLIRVGGVVYVSLFPVNTRPGAADDRAQVLGALQASGLHIRDLSAGALAYRTPAFERTSLQSVGLTSLSAWRRGDLLTLWKVRSVAFGGAGVDALPSPVSSDETWFEVLIGARKVKVRGPFDDADDYPELISIEPNDVLPTVSRRYIGRSAIGLWLWDNRVYEVRGRTAFRSALRALSGPSSPAPIPWHVTWAHHSRAVEILEDLLG